MATKKKRIYISGKITGLCLEDASVKFKEAEDYFKNLDYEVVNPLKLSHQHDWSWESFMREDIKAMMDCDGIALLQNYKDSKGALVEKQIAIELNFMVFCQFFLESPIDGKSIMVFSQIN